jgi:UDP-N-acetylglucosamine 2-epimerase (non-hydrolysing)
LVVLRCETERPEAVDAGTVAMAGVDPDRVYDVVRMLLRGGHVYDRMSKAISPYGDGLASQRIVEILRKSVENT